MIYGDLHFHSTNSDGDKTPAERIAQIRAMDPNNQGIYALTDHDRFSQEFVMLARALGIRVVWATEISAHSRDLDLSLHVTCYTPIYSASIAAIVADVVAGRSTKILGQIARLQQNDFTINQEEFFRWIESKKMSRDSATNYHIAQYIWRTRDNRLLARDLTNGVLQSNKKEGPMLDFMKECLRENGNYPHIGYHEVPHYEPEISDLAAVAEQEGAILSIAHPNFSFTKYLETKYRAIDPTDQVKMFETKIVPKLVDSGIRNFEINALASPIWAGTIDRTVKRVNGLTTYGSDNHGHMEAGIKHGVLGVQNQFLTPEMIAHIRARLLEFAR